VLYTRRLQQLFLSRSRYFRMIGSVYFLFVYSCFRLRQLFLSRSRYFRMIGSVYFLFVYSCLCSKFTIFLVVLSQVFYFGFVGTDSLSLVHFNGVWSVGLCFLSLGVVIIYIYIYINIYKLLLFLVYMVRIIINCVILIF
jgi:hypothetical protein